MPLWTVISGICATPSKASRHPDQALGSPTKAAAATMLTIVPPLPRTTMRGKTTQKPDRERRFQSTGRWRSA
jgi:hypothetical protein